MTGKELLDMQLQKMFEANPKLNQLFSDLVNDGAVSGEPMSLETFISSPGANAIGKALARFQQMAGEMQVLCDCDGCELCSYHKDIYLANAAVSVWQKLSL